MPGIGRPATGRVLKAGIRPSLSVDVEVSGASDMFGVMRAALQAQQMEVLYGPDDAQTSAKFAARYLLNFSTIKGARACGLGRRTGSQAPRKSADIIFIRGDNVNLAPVTDAAGAFALVAHPGNFDTVIVDGRIVKQHGSLLYLDLRRLVADARVSRDRLMRQTHIQSHRSD